MHLHVLFIIILDSILPRKYIAAEFTTLSIDTSTFENIYDIELLKWEIHTLPNRIGMWYYAQEGSGSLHDREKRQEKAVAAIMRDSNAGKPVHVHEVEKVTLPVVTERTLPTVMGVLYFNVLEARLDEKRMLCVHEFNANGLLVASDDTEDSRIAPYITIRVGDKIFETRVVEKLNPVWNQRYHMYVYCDRSPFLHSTAILICPWLSKSLLR